MPTDTTTTDTDTHPTVSVEDVSADAYPRRTLLVDFLFLDRDRCDRCRGTEASLREAIDRLEPVFDDLGVGVIGRNVRVETETDARRTRLESSPTVRIDGRDVQAAFGESPCESCSEQCRSETGIDCRTWTYGGEQHAHAPVELLLEALLRAALSERRERPERPTDPDHDAGRDPYRLPENLRTFFEGADRSADDEDDETETGIESCC